MKKNKTKLLSYVVCILMVIVTAFGATGCVRDAGAGGDADKSQLYIGAYGGGFGTAYLEDLKVRFEEYAKDMVFEEGKKGVQVHYVEDKDKYGARTLVNNILEDDNDLFYLSGDALDDFLEGGNTKLLDITDVITESLAEFGETGTIADKLKTSAKNHHLRDGHYYSVPFADSSLGVIYDIDVFEEYKLYFAKNGAPSEKLQQGGSFSAYAYVGEIGDKSAGPDGKYGTGDDGLPATLDEFQVLLNRMSAQGVDSIIWTEMYADTYTSFLPRAFFVDYHGADEAMIRIDGGGESGRETSLITSFDANGDPVIERKTVGLSNIKDSGKQAGYYYGLKMFEMLVQSGTVSAKAFQGLSHVEAQYNFLTSNIVEGEKPIAMLIEGTWWEGEAETSGSFNNCVEEVGEAKGAKENRHFGLFPMPKATEADVGKSTTIIGGTNSIVIRKNLSTEKANLAKTFLKFSLTDESLSKFTSITGLPMPYNYDMDTEDYAKMSGFAKGYWDTYKTSEVYYEFRPKSLINNSALTSLDMPLSYLWSIKPDGVTGYGLIPNEMKFNNVTAKDYFEGIYRKLTIG